VNEYQKFAISNFRSGFNEAFEPWLMPKDAFQQMINCHLYRGVLERISGYSLFAKMSYRNSISLGVPDGVTKTFTVTISPLPVTSNFYAYGTIVAGSSAEIFRYDSDGVSPIVNLVGDATPAGTGTVNTSTGEVSITFNTAPPIGTYSCMFFSWDSAPSVAEPIMGIQPYYATNSTQSVMIFDTRRVGIIQDNDGFLSQASGAIQGVQEIPHEYYQSAVFTGDAVVTTFTSGGTGAALVATLFKPGTVKFLQFTSTGVKVSAPPSAGNPGGVIMDNGVGGFIAGNNVVQASSRINYVTGAYTITFSAAPANGNKFDASVGIYGDLFSGDFSNFFTLCNYQYSAFFTNYIDNIFYYDGTMIRYLNTNLEVKLTAAVSGVPQLDITKCLHVFANRERLLLISPVVDQIPVVSGVFWSSAGNPFDFTNDEQLIAPTSEPIRTYGFINSDLVLRFANSERIFRYTSDAFSPFRFDSSNNIWACDAPYSNVNYDTWFSSIGRPAIVGSDGVNVKRADEVIPDFTDPTRLALQAPVPYINQTSIAQCYGERFDSIKEGWICYNNGNAFTEPEPSNNILAFNYLDATYAVYNFPLSCLGLGAVSNLPTWGNTYTQWQNTLDTWDSYQLQVGSLIELGGDQYGNVFQMDDSNAQTFAGDATATLHPVLMSAITKNFNPFTEDGQLCRFGYLDLFVTANASTVLRVQFYMNDQLYVDVDGNPAGYYQETILTFNTTDSMSPSVTQTKVWKRIYVGSVGKTHTIRFYQNLDDFGETNDQPVYIHAMVLYMKPAGRVFN